MEQKSRFLDKKYRIDFFNKKRIKLTEKEVIDNRKKYTFYSIIKQILPKLLSNNSQALTRFCSLVCQEGGFSHIKSFSEWNKIVLFYYKTKFCQIFFPAALSQITDLLAWCDLSTVVHQVHLLDPHGANTFTGEISTELSVQEYGGGMWRRRITSLKFLCSGYLQWTHSCSLAEMAKIHGNLAWNIKENS